MFINKKPHRLGVPTMVRASAHDDGIVLFHTGNGRLFASNRTGARIWQCLEKGMALDAIASEVGREYGIAQAIAREHTANFLMELQRHGLIET